MTKQRRSRLEQFFIRLNGALRDKSDDYLSRRPHRSFRRTYRRDYLRSFALPGYFGLTRDTFGFLARDWRLFGLFFILYTAAAGVIVGIASQSNYSTVVSVFKETGQNVWLQALSVFGTAITGGLGTATTTGGGLTSVLMIILGWLIMVWLLRQRMANTTVKLRQALYTSGAPLIPTAIIMFVGVIQTIPIVAATLAYSAASNTGLLNQGIEAMLFYVTAALLVLMSLYWLTSTFIALIVVTLPGMYPAAALRAAGDLVVGRRLRLILRLLWLVLIVVILWAVILIPVIMLDTVINLAWLPIVPVFVLLLSAATLIISSTYIYLLYRRLVDDEAKPA